MKSWQKDNLEDIPLLKLAVIGHVEWVTFLAVDKLPKAGVISHSKRYLEEPAGGGAVTAVALAKLTNQPVHFFTALGKDLLGEMSFERLKELGLNLNVTWKEQPTRKGFSFIDNMGERAITVAGERIQPSGKDNLPWEELVDYDGVFISATDSSGLKLCREARVLVGTPRIGLNIFEEANVKFDALIGSGLDPDEKDIGEKVSPNPLVRISTEGALGGEAWPGGRYKATKLKSKIVDTYGCGDNFAAGVTVGLASKWSLEKAISLGAHLGAKCTSFFGPYCNRS